MFVPSQMIHQGTIYLDCQEVKGGGENMAVHHGGKVGKAGKTLASKTTSKSAKSKAGKTLADHKAAKH